MSKNSRLIAYALHKAGVPMAGAVAMMLCGCNANEPVDDTATYRWKVQDNALVSIGKNDNSISVVTGDIVDGKFSDAQYQIEKPIKLFHNEPWILEFELTPGTGMHKIFDESGVKNDVTSRCISARSGSNAISFAHYDGTRHYHFGVILSDHGLTFVDKHFYHLENRINDDGTNMVWLFVDGIEIAPMRTAFTANGGVSGTDDWVSGKDFTFGFIGSANYLHDGCIIDDIVVWESNATVIE